MNHPQLLRAFALGAALALCGASHAQALKTDDVTAAQTRLPTAIKLNNVPSDIMAYWLDPARQRVPIQLAVSTRNGDLRGGIVDDLPRQPGNALGPLGLKLPQGIDEIIPIEPQRVLLVRGTQVGIEELRQLVQRVDVPLRQTEVEVLFLELTPAAMKELNLPFRWTKVNGKDDKLQPAIADAEMLTNERLNALLANGSANNFSKNFSETTVAGRILTAPRVRALDGLTALLNSTETRTLKWPIGDDKTPAPQQDAWKAGIAKIQTETGIRVKCASKDDLIAMDLQIMLNDETARMSAIVRDGQKLALLLPRREPSNGVVHIAIVTPRIIRRAE